MLVTGRAGTVTAILVSPRGWLGGCPERSVKTVSGERHFPAKFTQLQGTWRGAFGLTQVRVHARASPRAEERDRTWIPKENHLMRQPAAK